MLLGFVTGDYARVADVHFQAGYIPPETDRAVFQQAIRAIGEPIFDRPPNEISIARLLAQLFQVSERFHMEAQPQLLLLQKTMLVAEGVGRRLAPELNMWQLAQPLIEEWMRENRGPEAQLADITADAILALQRPAGCYARPGTCGDHGRRGPRRAGSAPRRPAALAHLGCGGCGARPRTDRADRLTANGLPGRNAGPIYLHQICVDYRVVPPGRTNAEVFRCFTANGFC